MSDPIVITSSARTAIGSLQGQFAETSASALGAAAIQAAVERSQLNVKHVDEVIMGCVLQAGQGQAPARQAALGAGLTEYTPCTTINKMCGSGLKAVMQIHDAIKAGSINLGIAGGLENMTRAPYLINKARSGYRLGHGELYDHMFLDGLEDAYEKGQLMGVFAEATAAHYQFSREAQDEFAIASLQRAQHAITNGYFTNEIAPVTVRSRKGETVFATDEQPSKGKADKIPTLKPAFAKDGTVTAANASSISDGAAALVLTTASKAKAEGLPIQATICGHSSYAHAPGWFTTAPVTAIKKLLTQLNWQIADVDLFEINEAFAVVTMAAMQELSIPHDSVNIHGGACALGHPVGASGARILITLIHAMQRISGKRGIASLCIGGGEAVAVAIELA